jgi:hypothetical protein
LAGGGRGAYVGFGLVIVHGQSVMVRVWLAVAVYVFPLVVMVVAAGQKVVKAVTVSVTTGIESLDHPRALFQALAAATSPKTERT